MPLVLKQLAALMLALVLSANGIVCACALAGGARVDPAAGHESGQSASLSDHHHGEQAASQPHMGHYDTVPPSDRGVCSHEPAACEAGHQSPVIVAKAAVQQIAIVHEPAPGHVLPQMVEPPRFRVAVLSLPPDSRPRPPPRPTPVALKVLLLT